MTVNTLNITSGPFVGNGVTTQFAYTFRVEDKTELIVFETDDNNVETTLTVDTDYTVAGIGVDGGGTVTRVTGALPTDFEWFIRSNYIETQDTAFDSQGGFFPDVHEKAMDKLTFLIQQIIDKQSRAPAVSDSYSGTLPLSMSDPAAGLFLKWNAAEDGIENSGAPSLIIPDIQFSVVSDMVASTSIVIGDIIQTLGYKFKGDGGDNTYEAVASGTGTDDGGSFIDLFTHQARAIFPGGTRYVKHWGADGDATPGSATALQAASDFADYLYFDDGSSAVTYDVTGLTRRANTTWDMGNAVVLRTQNLDQNLLEAIGTSYSVLLDNIKTIGGTFKDTSASVSSGVIFAFCGNIQMNGTKFEGLAKNNTPTSTDLAGHEIAGLAISSCVGGKLTNLSLSGFRDDGLILSGGTLLAAIQPLAKNGILIDTIDVKDMAISGIGSNRGANGCTLTNFNVERCGDGFSWVSFNSGDNVIGAGTIDGDPAVSYGSGTYGLRMGHGYGFGSGLSLAPKTTAADIVIRNTGNGASCEMTDGGSIKNVRIFDMDFQGLMISMQREFEADVYIEGCGTDGVEVRNSDGVKLRGTVVDVQESGLRVREATLTDPASPEGTPNLDVLMKFKDYSLAGLDVARGAIFFSQLIPNAANMKIHGCEFKSSIAVNCIVHRHTKEIVSYYDNVVTGAFSNFILAANQARQQSAQVRDNRKLTSGTEVALYPEHVIETGRGSGATTSITSTKYGEWAELLTDATDYATQTSALIDAGTTNTAGNALSFTAVLASSTVTYTYTGGGTLSFSMQMVKTIAVTP